MVPLPPLNESDMKLVADYSLSCEEQISVGLVNAFQAADIDAFEEETQLVDWIDTDVFTALNWCADRPIYLSTRIWCHQVVITAEEIRIYDR